MYFIFLEYRYSLKRNGKIKTLQLNTLWSMPTNSKIKSVYYMDSYEHVKNFIPGSIELLNDAFKTIKGTTDLALIKAYFEKKKLKYKFLI